MTPQELERVDIGILREQTSQNAKQIERLTTAISGIEGRLTQAVEAVEAKMESSLNKIQSDLKGISTPNLNNVWRIITFAVSVIGLIGTFLFGIAQWQITQMRSEFEAKLTAVGAQLDFKLQALDRLCLERNASHEKHMDKIDAILDRANQRELDTLNLFRLHSNDHKLTP